MRALTPWLLLPLIGCDAVSARRPVPAAADRVVSLVPSATELILALGRADRLVARTAYDHQPGIADVPSFGRTMTPGAEAIVALEPDLVLLMHAPTTERLTGELEALGVRVERVEARRLMDVPRIARRLGEWLDAPQPADSLARAFAARIAEVRDRARPSDRPSVFYLLWHDPPWTAGAGTFIGDLIEAAGGRHAFPDADGAWPRIGVEAVVERDPDVLVVPTGTLPDEPLCWLRDSPGWSDLTAVREGRVVVVPKDLFNRPGPRLVQAAERLARALHPPAADAERRHDGRAAAVGPGEPDGRRAWAAHSPTAGSGCSA